MVPLSLACACLGLFYVVLGSWGDVESAIIPNRSDWGTTVHYSTTIHATGLAQAERRLQWHAISVGVKKDRRFRALALYAKELLKNRKGASILHWRWAQSVVYMHGQFGIKNYGGRTIEKQFYSYASFKADFPDGLFTRLSEIWQFWAESPQMAVPSGEELVRLLKPYLDKL